jgi:hypothetical protein
LVKLRDSVDLNAAHLQSNFLNLCLHSGKAAILQDCGCVDLEGSLTQAVLLGLPLRSQKLLRTKYSCFIGQSIVDALSKLNRHALRIAFEAKGQCFASADWKPWKRHANHIAEVCRENGVLYRGDGFGVLYFDAVLEVSAQFFVICTVDVQSAYFIFGEVHRCQELLGNRVSVD